MIRKKVSSEDADPTLSPGYSYFVEQKKYSEHLAKYGEQKDVVSPILQSIARSSIKADFNISDRLVSSTTP